MAEQGSVEVPPTESARDLLAHHEFVATYAGILNRPCMHMTSLCPDKCGHPNEFGRFTVDHYLRFVKEGEYGDEKIEIGQIYGYDMKDKHEGQKDFSDLIRTLAVGDKVQLAYDHDYVTMSWVSSTGTTTSCKGPQRPIKKLVKLTAEEAAELCAA